LLDGAQLTGMLKQQAGRKKKRSNSRFLLGNPTTVNKFKQISNFIVNVDESGTQVSVKHETIKS
jgi:hypothetical protein